MTAGFLIWMVQISSVSDYDLGGAGDLFKAPQPILEPPVLTLDHMTSSMFKEDLISQEVEFTNVESPQNETSITNIFQEFEDILSNEPSSPSQIMNSNGIITEENLHPLGKITKSVSSYCLTSMDDGPQTRPNSVTDTKMKGHGLRRAFSEGCIKAQLINDHLTETRMQKLSRYREKKMKRNFKRKVKYACRKALADNQPRIGGRFAKKEETNVFKKA
uniref:uncharacterized protein LOC122588012 n=1 Tax=Erigeron canadensis TaxID=72917 RepID=UPI001CB9CACA|nr:uncharacterized protein LOC122588012 [Erigeron canadensis]